MLTIANDYASKHWTDTVTYSDLFRRFRIIPITIKILVTTECLCWGKAFLLSDLRLVEYTDAQDLIEKCLSTTASERPTLDQVLHHRWTCDDQFPCVDKVLCWWRHGDAVSASDATSSLCTADWTVAANSAFSFEFSRSFSVVWSFLSAMSYDDNNVINRVCS